MNVSEFGLNLPHSRQLAYSWHTCLALPCLALPWADSVITGPGQHLVKEVRAPEEGSPRRKLQCIISSKLSFWWTKTFIYLVMFSLRIHSLRGTVEGKCSMLKVNINFQWWKTKDWDRETQSDSLSDGRILNTHTTKFLMLREHWDQTVVDSL